MNELAPRGSKFFHIREVPIKNKNAIDKNHCSILKFRLDVPSFLYVLVTLLAYWKLS